MTQVALDTTVPVPPAVVAQPPIAEPKPKMVTVKLLRHYRPDEARNPNEKGKYLPPVFEIVGYWKPAIVVRNKLGKEEELEPTKFIEGENAPPPQAGVGFATKLWAGTVVRFTTTEAKRIKGLGIGEIEVDDD